jgi:probable F420-dependent oxidoreductase
MPSVHFGVTIPQIKRTWDECQSASREFEAMGFDSLWVCDHLYGPQSPQIPILEAWTLLGAVAAITSRVELGTLVTPAGMRNPGHLGKTIATVDNIAGGRVIAGLGGGWMAREFTDFGVDFLPISQRLVQLRETVQLLKKMWSEPEVSFTGRYVKAEHLVCEPKPPRRVPILVGGGGEKVTLRIAAEEADIWNNLAGAQAKLGEKAAKLREHCEAIGRDPASIVVSQQCLVTIARRRRCRADDRDGEEGLRGPHGRPNRSARDRRQPRPRPRADPEAHRPRLHDVHHRVLRAGYEGASPALRRDGPPPLQIVRGAAAQAGPRVSARLSVSTASVAVFGSPR